MSSQLRQGTLCALIGMLSHGCSDDDATGDVVVDGGRYARGHEEVTAAPQDSGVDGSDGEAPDSAVDGDSGSAEPVIVGGSRLDVRWDAGVSFLSFIDRELGDMPCVFEPGGGGVYHCVPTHALLGGHFSDADCSQPVGFVPAVCAESPASAIVRHLASDECLPGSAMRLGEALTSGSVYTDEPACSESEPAENAAGAWHRLEPVDQAELVSAHVEIVDVGDVLVRRLLATDGTVINLELLTHDGERCEVVNGRCLPGKVAHWNEGVHVDPECADDTPVASVMSSCGGATSNYILRIAPDRDCGDPLYEVYEAVGSLSETYRGSPDACRLVSGGRYVMAGARVDEENFPEMHSVLVGTGRIRAYAVASSQGTQLLPPSANPYDTELEASCVPQRFADGKTRCVTGILGNFVDLYTDAQCTSAAGIAVDATCAAGEAGQHYLYSQRVDDCFRREIEQLYEAVPFSGQLYRIDGSGSCLATDGAAGTQYVAAGEEVPLERFAEL